jgi:hypothetical protein
MLELIVPHRSCNKELPICRNALVSVAIAGSLSKDSDTTVYRQSRERFAIC